MVFLNSVTKKDVIFDYDTMLENYKKGMCDML